MELKYMSIGTDSGSEGDATISAVKSDDDDPSTLNQVPLLSKGKLILLNVAWTGMMMSFLVLAVAVVPSQIQYLVGSKDKAKALSLVAASGSVVTLLAAPLIGYFSDRCRSRWGRRKPFMVVGAVITCICLVGVTLSAPHFAHTNKYGHLNGTSCDTYNRQKPSCGFNRTVEGDAGHASTERLVSFILCYVILFVGYTMVATAYNGLIADVTHHSVRGFSSGVMGLMMLLGNLAGAALGVVAERLTVAGTYSVVAVFFFGTIMVTVCSVEDSGTSVLPAVKASVFNLKSIFMGYVEPLFEHDFRWVFITRFLMQMGIATTLGFLEYWFDDMVNLPHCISPIQAVSIALLPLLLIAAVCSVIGGILSDHLKRRKILVVTAALIMAAAAGSEAVVRVFWLAVVIAVLFGLGLGAFISVDFAMVMDILPNESDKAKDLAVWHQALVLPQLVATPIGGLILHGLQQATISNNRHGCSIGLGYIVLFSITALYFLISALLVLKIRRVR